METRQLLLNEAQWILGWMSMEELSLLAEIASTLRPNSTIFEIGCLCGRSTRAIADNMSIGTQLYAIDPWDHKILSEGEPIIVDESTFNQFTRNLMDHIADDKVIIINKRWEDYHPDFHADFIFIDGDHEYKSVKHDIAKALRYLNPMGVLAGHDYNFATVWSAVNEFFTKDQIKTRGSIWWMQKF